MQFLLNIKATEVQKWTLWKNLLTWVLHFSKSFVHEENKPIAEIEIFTQSLISFSNSFSIHWGIRNYKFSACIPTLRFNLNFWGRKEHMYIIIYKNLLYVIWIIYIYIFIIDVYIIYNMKATRHDDDGVSVYRNFLLHENIHVFGRTKLPSRKFEKNGHCFFHSFHKGFILYSILENYKT